jgi:hypothetical protein
VEGVIHGRRNRKFVELHQQVVFLIDAERLGMFSNVQKIFVIEMEIAPGGQFKAPVEFFGEGIAFGLHSRKVEEELRVAVGSGNYMGDAISDGVFGHGEGIFEEFGAVVEAEQDMAVEVNHEFF